MLGAVQGGMTHVQAGVITVSVAGIFICNVIALVTGWPRRPRPPVA